MPAAFIVNVLQAAVRQHLRCVTDRHVIALPALHAHQSIIKDALVHPAYIIDLYRAIRRSVRKAHASGNVRQLSKRLHLNGDRLDLFKAQDLQFFEPDYKKFKCLQLAFDAIKKGGNMSCIVNAANEIVNAGFRKGECGFLQMADIIEETMAKATFDSNPDLDVYLQTDAEARRIAAELMKVNG